MWVPGGTYFFTVALARRDDTVLADRIDALRAAYGATARAMPFRTDAVVVMPDHVHAVWRLPGGDADFAERWRRIKRDVAVAVGGDRRRFTSNSVHKQAVARRGRAVAAAALEAIRPRRRRIRRRVALR